MRKHTPGPWEQKHQGMLCQIAINSDSDTLATVYGESGENLANARLIAAAPELLEALEMIIAEADSYTKRTGTPVYSWLDCALATARDICQYATRVAG